jgi:hypothetical protein
LVPPLDPEEMVDIVHISEELAFSSSSPKGVVEVVMFW